jgi:tRNA1(Val) A37 N6-methylase TrmN6
MVMKKYVNQTTNIIRDVTYITDNTSASFAYSALKRKTDFFLFKPESHFGNNITLLKAIRKRLYEGYFGTEKNPENPFRNCKTPAEIFNLSRNIKFEIKMKLSRFGFVLLRNGEVNILHKEGSIIQNNVNIQKICKEFINNHELMIMNSPNAYEENKFNKYDYFLSAEMFEGIISANNYVQKGIGIPVLGDRKVYTSYGVFNPTRGDYLQLFDAYLRENIRDLKLRTNRCIDLGCGTGILSLIMSQFELPRIFAVDISDAAVTTTKSNAQALGYFDNIKAVKFDLVKHYYLINCLKATIKTKKSENNPENESESHQNLSSHNTLPEIEKYSQVLKENNIDNNLDLIVCNPPWLNASYVFSQTDLENGIYDPEHKFLKAAFNFAKTHLSRNNPDARFVIIFSDLGSILNINEPDLIENLALEFKFKITLKNMKQSEVKPSDGHDPLKNFKKESKVFLYELKRII